MIKQVQAPKQMHKYQYPFIPAPKVAVVKSNQVVTKVKEGIMEVRDMFQKVDHAFKKRKEESQVLAMTVSDLENHLAYLESQTQDQMASTTLLGSALYSRQEQINKLSKDVKEFEALDSEGFQALFDEMKESTELATDTGALVFEQSHVLENFMCEQGVTLGSLESTMEKYLADDAEEAAEVAKLLDDIKVKEQELEVAEGNARAAQKVDGELSQAIEQSRHDLPLKVSKLKSLQATLAEKKILCEQLTQKAVSLTEELTALDTTANTHRLAFEAQNALRMEEITTLTATFEKTRLHKDAKYQELQALQNQKGTLDTEVAAGETALRAITLTLRQEQSTEEKLRTEVHQLDAKMQAMREELSAARAASEQAAKDNEEQYQLTCARMTDLREAHQRQSSLSQTKHTLEEQLAARVRELTALAVAEEERVVREQQLLEQDEAKLTAATATLATTRAEVATLQSRAATTTAEVQAQVEEVHRLSELEAQLTAQKEKQAALRRQLAELERLREAQKTDAAGAAQELHAQQQKQRALDEALVEATAAQKKKQGDPTPTATQLELFEVDVQAAVEEQQAGWQAKHAAEVAEIETCREQLAKGFPEQTERAANEIHAKTAEVEAQRQAVQQADLALQQTRAELQHQQHLRHQHQLHLQALAIAQAQAQAQAEAEAKAKAAAQDKAIAEAEEQARQDAAAQALLVLQLQQQLQAAEALAQAQREAEAEALALAEAAAEAEAQALEVSRRAAYAPQASQRVSQRARATSSRASTPLSAADPFHLDLLLEHEHEHGGSGGVEVSSDSGSGGMNARGGGMGIASTPAVGTSSMNRSVSEATTAFMSPATTFPVPYSEAVTHQSTVITTSANSKDKGKSGKEDVAGASQLPTASPSQHGVASITPRHAEIPSMGSTMNSSNSNNRDALTRWERSEPAPPLQLPPHPAQLLAQQLSRGRGAGSSNTQSQQGSVVSRQGVVLSQVETSGSGGGSSGGGMDVVVSEVRVQVDGISSQQSQFGLLFGDSGGDVGGIVHQSTPNIPTTTANTSHNSVLSTHSDDLFEDSHSHVHVAAVTTSKRAKRTTAVTTTQHTSSTRQLATTTSNTVLTSTHPYTNTTLPNTTNITIPTTSHTTTDTSVSTPEEERAARRREKNKAHKQNQKARSRAAKAAAAADGASSVQSEDHSLDLLRPIAPVAVAAVVPVVNKPTTTATTTTTSTIVKPTNTNGSASVPTTTAATAAHTTSKPSKPATATTTMRPPLYRAPTVTPFAASLPGTVPDRAIRPASHHTNTAPHNTSSRPSASSATNSAGAGTSAGSSSWDIFGLPSPSTTNSGAGTAKKHTSKTTTGATAQVPGTTTTTYRPTTGADNTAARQPTNFNNTGNANNTNSTSSRVVGDKRKHSLTSTNTSTHTTSHKRSTTTNKQSVPNNTTHHTNPTNTTAITSQCTKPTTTNSNNNTTHYTNTNTTTTTTAPTAAASKKKKVSYVSEDWFDEEDAPF